MYSVLSFGGDPYDDIQPQFEGTARSICERSGWAVYSWWSSEGDEGVRWYYAGPGHQKKTKKRGYYLQIIERLVQAGAWTHSDVRHRTLFQALDDSNLCVLFGSLRIQKSRGAKHWPNMYTGWGFQGFSRYSHPTFLLHCRLARGGHPIHTTHVPFKTYHDSCHLPLYNPPINRLDIDNFMCFLLDLPTSTHPKAPPALTSRGW